jgi:hypothetical protein
MVKVQKAEVGRRCKLQDDDAASGRPTVEVHVVFLEGSATRDSKVVSFVYP